MAPGPQRTPPPTIELPQGFRATGLHCGLKSDGAFDLGLLLAEQPVAAAAIFTQNALQGAHIPVCRQHLAQSGGLVQAILVNSRNANCATGQRGIDDARRCCHELAQRLGCKEEHVLMASTGPIGAPLPADKILQQLEPLVSQATSQGGMDFANAIMTTDTHPKAATATNPSTAARVTGFTKGSGMIHPDMATMLGFLLTDAAAEGDLQTQLQDLADRSFHRATVDGDTSPNDSLFVLASATHSAPITQCRSELLTVATDLARQLAADGEGASRLITIEVRGANSEADACHVGRVIATSPLVKTAIAGRDPNWGRILSAAGRADVTFDTDKARVWVGETEVFTHGVPKPEREATASQHLVASADIVIGVDLGVGTAQADIWTCDLTADYIRINADYRT